MFDLRIHPASLRDSDIETLLQFSVRHALLFNPFTATDASADGLIAGFDALLEQRLRLKRLGLTSWVALGVHPSSLPKRGLERVLDAIQTRADPASVRALGAVGLSTGTPRHLEAFDAQVQLAVQLRLPILATLPVRQVSRAVALTLERLQALEVDSAQVCIDAGDVRALRPILHFGFVAGLTVHPDHLSVEAAVAQVNALGTTRVMLGSAAGHSASDLLSLALTAHRLEQQGLSASAIRRVTKENAAHWLGVTV